ILILVDRDNGARTLHSHHVLDRSADSEGEIQLRRDGLARAAGWAVHRQPALIADGARSSQFPAEQLREFFGQWNIFWRLDSPPDRNENRRLCEVHSLLCFPE